MKKIKFPRIPEGLKKNQRILTDTQISLAKRMLKTDSQRNVAKFFNVSRGCIVRQCVPGMKLYYKQKAREWDKTHPESKRTRVRKQMLRAYHILADAFPKTMSTIQKQAKAKRGKEYYTQKQREFRVRRALKISSEDLEALEGGE